MPVKPQSHSSLIGSRICHDLISPIGAIGNGLELLSLSDGQHGPEMALVEASVAQASARIRFFRIAFGIADEAPLAAAEIADILRGMQESAREQVTFSETQAVSRNTARLLFLGMMCVETAMPFGGTIALIREAQGWLIEGRGDRLQPDEQIWRDLEDGTGHATLTPATVQFALLREGAAELGLDLAVTRKAETLAIRF